MLGCTCGVKIFEETGEYVEGEKNMTKSGITLEEHRKVGAELRLIRNNLVSLSVRLVNEDYRNVIEDIDKEIKRIDILRSDLDDIVFKDNPELDSSVLASIYY